MQILQEAQPYKCLSLKQSSMAFYSAYPCRRGRESLRRIRSRATPWPTQPSGSASSSTPGRAPGLHPRRAGEGSPPRHAPGRARAHRGRLAPHPRALHGISEISGPRCRDRARGGVGADAGPDAAAGRDQSWTWRCRASTASPLRSGSSRIRVRAGIPVIVLTGYAFRAIEHGALEAGADVFLTKPCLPEDLEAKIRQLLPNEGRRTPTSPRSDPSPEVDRGGGVVTPWARAARRRPRAGPPRRCRRRCRRSRPPASTGRSCAWWTATRSASGWASAWSRSATSASTPRAGPQRQGRAAGRTPGPRRQPPPRRRQARAPRARRPVPRPLRPPARLRLDRRHDDQRRAVAARHGPGHDRPPQHPPPRPLPHPRTHRPPIPKRPLGRPPS